MVDNMGTGVGISSLTCSSQGMLIFRFPSAILEFRVRMTSGIDDNGTIEKSVAEDMVVAVGILFLTRSEVRTDIPGGQRNQHTRAKVHFSLKTWHAGPFQYATAQRF